MAIVLDGGGDLCGVGHVDDGVFHTPEGEDLLDEAVGAAVGVVGYDDVVAGFEQDAQDDVDSCHAGGVGDGEVGVFKRRNSFFQGGDGGVSHACVFVAAAEFGEAVLGEGGGGVDGGVDWPVEAVGLVACVDGVGGESVDSHVHRH